MNRKQAREEAFVLIFEKVFNPDSVEDILQLANEVRDLKPDDYIKTVFFGVYDNLETLDSIISKNAIGWSITRISKTALSVLRLSLFEIKFMDDIPISVSINEAVELCKKYATKEDASFVNGLLSTVAKSL
jgi:N utilization substance protein B